jgi:hypothetical protein
MRLEPRKEAWLKFAHDFWDIDNGQSSLEIIEQMLTKHVENARNIAYGYNGYLDETLGIARAAVEDTERDNLVDTLHSLCDIGEGDAVARALKNVTLGAIQRNTGFRAVQLNGGAKITAGGSPSPVKFNGSIVKRGATKTFNDVVDAPTKSFNRVVSDSVNINASAKSILKEAMARKADGRLINPTNAASTLKTTPATTEKGDKPMTKFTDDEDTLEGTWSSHMKKDAVEANRRMKSDTEAAKTVELPVVRLNSFEDTRARLPFEFRGVNPSDMATRLTQGVDRSLYGEVGIA